MDFSTRLNKYISESGLCSRRAADRYIELGQVFINGKRAKVGDQVKPGDRVSVNGQNIEPSESKNTVILAYNKPVGVTSTTESAVKDNIVDHVNYSERIFPIGRLDKDSQGLIFLTNNGDLVNKILRAGNNHEKEYLVTVDRPVTDDFISDMAGGVPILGVMTKKCKVKKEGNNSFRITLIQGLNRQIRRMCEHFGYQVTKLERVRIMHIKLKGLAVGDWRELEEEELEKLYQLLSNSSSEADSNKTSAIKAAKEFSKQRAFSAKTNADKRNKSHSKTTAKPGAKNNRGSHKAASKNHKPKGRGR